MKITLTLLSCLTLFMACGPDNKVDAPGLRDAVENRKIKKIKEPEIEQRAYEMGNKFIKICDSTLNAQVDLTDSTNCEELNEVKFSRILKIFGSDAIIVCAANTDDKMEQQLYEAIEYNFQNNIEATVNVQKHESQYYIVNSIHTPTKFIGMLLVKIPKKQVVLASDDTWKYKYEKRDKK